jgi:hypothetical protein
MNTAELVAVEIVIVLGALASILANKRIRSLWKACATGRAGDVSADCRRYAASHAEDAETEARCGIGRIDAVSVLRSVGSSLAGIRHQNCPWFRLGDEMIGGLQQLC